MRISRVSPILVLALGLAVWLGGVSEAAALGTGFTYQGRLLDDNKAADGLYDFVFSLYDDPNVIVGNQVGGSVEVNDLDVIDGHFTVELDFGAGIFDGNERYLQFAVRPGESEDPEEFIDLLPRQMITPAPYALFALNGSGGGVWSKVGNDIYYTAGNVGIGTTSPIFKLDVTNPTAGGSVESGVNADDAGGALAAYSSTYPAPFTHLADRVSLWSNGFTATGLDLRADGATSDMRFYTGGHFPANERMRITDDGYLGIGTTSPELKLAVEDGGININSLLDDGAGRWNRGLVFTNNSNGMGPWTHAAIWSDGVSGFNGELVFGVDGDDKNNMWSLTDPQIQEAMRIDKSGNLGIGTDSPGFRLDVKSSGSGDVVGVTSSDGDPLFKIRQASGGHGGVYVCNATGGNTVVIGGFGDTYFNAGNVGIGMTSPGAKLDVNGDLRVTGAYRGNIGPNNGAPFPRPAYDSGWASIEQGQDLTIIHGVGGSVDNYFLDILWKSPAGLIHDNHLVGAWWKALTNNQIRVSRGSADSTVNQVRVRIWVYN